MSKYFRIVGYLSLIGVVASSVEIIVMMAKNVSNYTFFFYLMILIFAVIFGPALGLLFISHANVLDGIANKAIKDQRIELKRVNKENEIRKEMEEIKSSIVVENYKEYKMKNQTQNRLDEEKKEVKPKEEKKPEPITTFSKDLIQLDKEYIEPTPSNGKDIYWNNHIRGEIVILDCETNGIPAKSIGRVLGITSDKKIDVQFEIGDEIKVLSLYNNVISVKETVWKQEYTTHQVRKCISVVNTINNLINSGNS